MNTQKTQYSMSLSYVSLDIVQILFSSMNNSPNRVFINEMFVLVKLVSYTSSHFILGHIEIENDANSWNLSVYLATEMWKIVTLR